MDYDVIVIGAGATGLIAANCAIERGLTTLVLEAEERPGGRLATDREGGYVFDRGFQILLTAYPAVERWLDLRELGVKSFSPGAHILLPGGGRTTVGDPLRRPGQLLETLGSPVGTLSDKLRLLRLVAYVRSTRNEELFATRESSTERFLVEYGFSARMIDLFFRPFYGGIFLERELATSSRFFLFTFKMFAEGQTVLPRRGIQAIGEQLASRLPTGTVRYGASVSAVGRSDVRLIDGTEVTGRQVIDTRQSEATAAAGPSRWLTTVNVYFATARTALPPRLITLVPGGGPVNNLAVLTSVHPGWAPPRTQLISATMYARPGATTEEYARAAKSALAPWLAEETAGWRALRHYEVSRALPFTPHAAWGAPAHRWRGADGVIRTGDWRLHPSLQAAMWAGEQAVRGLTSRDGDPN